MNTNTYIEKAKDKEILNHILLHIASDDAIEDEYAKMIENATDGEITKDEFHDWIGSFDINDYIN